MTKTGAVIILLAVAAACAETPAFERIIEARRLSAELLLQFRSATDATNRTVMAAGTPAAAGFARQADAAIAAIEEHAATIRPPLEGMRYRDELGLLDRFQAQFDDYRKRDRQIQELLADSSNVKARQIAFGPADEAANTIEQALQAAAADVSPPAAKWHALALAGTVTTAVRTIQVLQWRHIPESEAAVMDALDRQIAAAEGEARTALQRLAAIVPASSRPALAAATTAVDRFVLLNADLTQQSRRNSNVHALALVLGEQGAVVARCEDTLRALQDALAKRGFSGTR